VDCRVETIIDFWFGDCLDTPLGVPRERSLLWFGGGVETDQVIRARFGACFERARQGDCDRWAESPRGALALLVLLDQFSRNLFRGTAAAFAADEQAREICLAGLARGDDQQLPPLARVFFYLPLEHAEDLALQERSVALFTALLEQALPAQRDSFAGFLDYAVRHRDIIARFGRFPHRNRLLGRASSAEEVAFLRLPGSSF